MTAAEVKQMSNYLQQAVISLQGLSDRMTGLGTRMAGLEGRMTGMEGRMTGVETRLTNIESTVIAARQEARERDRMGFSTPTNENG